MALTQFIRTLEYFAYIKSHHNNKPNWIVINIFTKEEEATVNMLDIE